MDKITNENKLKIRIDRKLLLATSVVFLLVFGVVWYAFFSYRPVLGAVINGSSVLFRNDIRAADKISVYPNKSSIHDLFSNPSVTNITIAFKPSSLGENGLYVLEESEVIFKTSFLYANLYRFQPKYNAIPVSDYSNITSTPNNLVVALIAPSLANETSVRLVGNTVFISGTDAKQFDLATEKFEMTILEVKP